MNMHMRFILDLPLEIAQLIILLIMIIMKVALPETHFLLIKIGNLVLKKKIMIIIAIIVLLIIILVVGGLIVVM